MALAAQTSWLKIATVRAFVVFNRHKHTLPALPYDYNALEPAISAEIMQLHHQKHHATYVNNLNAAEEQLKDFSERGDLAGALALQLALKFNGGGHINHSIFWEILSPSGGGEPHGELRAAIEKDFGSVDNFRTQLSTRSVAVQGSGWGWLGYNKLFQRLEVATCSNQDPLLPSTGMRMLCLIPLLGIDVWEHAYYLQYKNVRPEYVKNLWDIVNWQEVANRYSAAKQ